MKRRWKILLVLAVVCVLGYVSFISHGSYRRTLEAYKQDLRAKGEKLTIDELTPTRSAGMSPGAVQFMAVSNLGQWPTNLALRMATVTSNRAVIGYTNITPDQLSDYAQNAQTMAALRTALATGLLDFNLDYSMGAELPLPHLVRFKQAEQLASGTTLQALKKEDFAEAWLDLLASADAVRLLRHDRLLISDLVRVADVNIAIPATWEALEGHVWTEAQLAELQAKWQDTDLFTNAPPALDMEGAVAIDAFVKARATQAKFDLYTGMMANRGGASATTGGTQGTLSALRSRFLGYWAWKFTWSYDEELHYLQCVIATTEVANRIIEADAFYPAFNELAGRYTNINALHASVSNHFLIFPAGSEMVMRNYLARLGAGESFRRLLVTAIALKRYQLAHGANPASLKELVPHYLAREPIDFMDGKPLRYRLEPDGEYVLYSVGEDGQVGRVWPRPAKPAEIRRYFQSEESSTIKPAK